MSPPQTRTQNCEHTHHTHTHNHTQTLLRHDKPIHRKQLDTMSHLKHVPAYLKDPAIVAAGGASSVGEKVCLDHVCVLLCDVFVPAGLKDPAIVALTRRCVLLLRETLRAFHSNTLQTVNFVVCKLIRLRTVGVSAQAAGGH